MRSFLYTVFIVLALILSLSGQAVEIVNLGGLRQVSAEIEQNQNIWKIKIRMLPVKCFTHPTNKKVTRSYAKRYAMTALAVHLGKKTLSAQSCSILSENFLGDKAGFLLHISNLSPIPLKRNIPQSSSNAVENISASSGNLLSRKNDWLNILNSFFTVLESEICSFEKYSEEQKRNELYLKIANFEDEYNKNCKSFSEKIKHDIMLLSTEQNELLNLMQKKQSVINARLQKIAEKNPSVSDLFSKIDIQEKYKPFLLSNLILMENGGAQLYEISNSRYLLISVGFTDVRADTAADRIRQKKAAKINALVNLLKMTGVKVYSRSVITDEFSVVKGIDGKDKVISLEEIFETTVEQAQGKVRALPVIGTWYSKDGTVFYTATGEFIHHE